MAIAATTNFPTPFRGVGRMMMTAAHFPDFFYCCEDIFIFWPSPFIMALITSLMLLLRVVALCHFWQIIMVCLPEVSGDFLEKTKTCISFMSITHESKQLSRIVTRDLLYNNDWKWLEGESKSCAKRTVLGRFIVTKKKCFYYNYRYCFQPSIVRGKVDL
jgi:hypothetical protein